MFVESHHEQSHPVMFDLVRRCTECQDLDMTYAVRRIVREAATPQFIPAAFTLMYKFAKPTVNCRPTTTRHVLRSLGWKVCDRSCDMKVSEHILKIQTLIRQGLKYKNRCSKLEQKILLILRDNCTAETLCRLSSFALGCRRCVIHSILHRLPVNAHRLIVFFLEENRGWKAWIKLRGIRQHHIKRKKSLIAQTIQASSENHEKILEKRAFEQYLFRKYEKTYSCNLKIEDKEKITESLFHSTTVDWSSKVDSYENVLKPSSSLLLDTSVSKIVWTSNTCKEYRHEAKYRCKYSTLRAYSEFKANRSKTKHRIAPEREKSKINPRKISWKHLYFLSNLHDFSNHNKIKRDKKRAKNKYNERILITKLLKRQKLLDLYCNRISKAEDSEVPNSTTSSEENDVT